MQTQLKFASASGSQRSRLRPPLRKSHGLHSPKKPDSPIKKSFDTPEDGASAGSILVPAAARPHRRRVTAKTIRLRDKEHCKFVASQPCIVCGRIPTEAHHIRFAQPRALGRKVSDEYTVPVCRLHHRELHAYGDEASWWAGVNIDPLPIALEFWGRSRSNESA